MDNSKSIIEAWTNEKGCPICLIEDIDNKIETKCHHAFCNDCLNEWLRLDNTCPLCRQPSPVKTPTKLLDIRCNRLLGPLKNIEVYKCLNSIKMKMFMNRTCILKIKGETLVIKSGYGFRLLKISIRKIKSVISYDSKITLLYVSNVNTNKFGICSKGNYVQQENKLTFNMSNSNLAKELVGVFREWFEAGDVYEKDLHSLAQRVMRERSVSVTSNYSDSSY